MKKPNLTIVLIVGIILIFGLIGLFAIRLANKEEQTTVSTKPIASKSEGAKPSGILVSYADVIQAINPDTGQPLGTDKINLTTSSPATSTNSFSRVDRHDLMKISPDGRYLATLAPEPDMIRYDAEGQKQNQLSTITVYDLSTGESTEVVEADSKTIISSFSWDWQSNAIGFLTAKKVRTQSIQLFFLPSSSNSGKITLNRVELSSGKASSEAYPGKSSYANYNVSLLATNGNTYYLSDQGSVVTVGAEVKQSMEEDKYGWNRVYSSPDYKSVALTSDYEIQVYNLEKKTKQLFSVGDGNLQGSRIGSIAFGTDNNGIAFVKTAPAAKANSSANSSASYSSPHDSDTRSTVESIWYYNFADQKFTEISSRTLDNDSYSYTSSVSIVFSAAGDKIAAVISDSKPNQPIQNQTIETFDLAGKSLSKNSVTFSTSRINLLKWY